MSPPLQATPLKTPEMHHTTAAARGGGGASIEPPKTGGFRKRAQFTGPLISCENLWRQSFENGFFLPNTWQMMLFLNLLVVLIPKIRFPFLAKFQVRVTSGARGSVECFFG